MTHTRFQVQHVLFWVRVADLRLGDLNNHICYKFSELFGCKSEGLIGFWLRKSVLAYYWGVWLLIVDHMLSERSLFVFRTPFVRSNMWSVTICTCGFSWFSTWASFMWMILSADQIRRRWANGLTLLALTSDLRKFVLLANRCHDKNMNVKQDMRFKSEKL